VDNRAAARARFAKSAELFMLKREKLDVVVLDDGAGGWHVLRTDGTALTAREDYAFRCYLAGYRIFNRAVL
jgi:hypothetical protein